VALAIAERLGAMRGTGDPPRVHFLSRGYGGRETGPLRVSSGVHDANAVGDEPLLLAEVAPTWVGARRCETAAAACASGAEILLMDDGLQHATLHRDLSLLCVDTTYLWGNRRVLPAGPLREPIERALARTSATVAITAFGAPTVAAAARTPIPAVGATRSDAALRAALSLPDAMPLLMAALEPTEAAAARLSGARVVAFSGTARPQKFFDTLLGLGCSFACPPTPLPDHAELDDRLIDTLRLEAARLDALVVTTSKDFVRMSQAQRDGVHELPVRLKWLDGSDCLLDALVAPLVARAGRDRSHETGRS
jgi:tetraacyldisaccharide 4'-kinase